jgi:hypothetical protein
MEYSRSSRACSASVCSPPSCSSDVSTRAVSPTRRPWGKTFASRFAGASEVSVGAATGEPPLRPAPLEASRVAAGRRRRRTASCASAQNGLRQSATTRMSPGSSASRRSCSSSGIERAPSMCPAAYYSPGRTSTTTTSPRASGSSRGGSGDRYRNETRNGFRQTSAFRSKATASTPHTAARVRARAVHERVRAAAVLDRRRGVSPCRHPGGCPASL